MRKYIAVAALLLLTWKANASLETITKCNENICLSFAKHRSDEFKDYYAYGSASEVRQIVVRFKSGSLINIVFSRASAECNAKSMKVLSQDAKHASGEGCLTMKDQSMSVLVKYTVTTVGVDHEQFFQRVDPAIWLTGYDAKGKYLPAASPIVRLSGQ